MNEYMDEYMDEWVDCGECGGEGVNMTMCACQVLEDTCCCLSPTPIECNICDGEGGWHPIPTAPATT